jgi:hypothetical protein
MIVRRTEIREAEEDMRWIRARRPYGILRIRDSTFKSDAPPMVNDTIAPGTYLYVAF